MQEHKFKHSFQDMLNLSCNCGMSTESSTVFLLKCRLFLNKRCSLMSSLNKIDPQISKFTLPNWVDILFFGIVSFSNKINTVVLDTPKDYLSTKRFNESLIF